MKRTFLVLLLFVPVCVLLAQHQHGQQPAAPAAKKAEAGHHAYLEMERGEGFGMAMAADKAGYPGPKHVLELKNELKLTPEQAAGMEKLFAEMKQKALERGREVLNAEERLAKMFAEGRSEDELREETYRIASLRAELRWVHLRTHLAAKKVLSQEQLAKYTQLRHGSGEHAH